MGFPINDFNIDPDSILKKFVKIERNIPSEITKEDLISHVNALILPSSVPEAILRVFETAKSLYVFGFYKYQFFTVAEHYALLTIESALRNKHTMIFGKPKKFISLHEVITDLEKKNIITFQEKEKLLLNKNLRNCMSHLEFAPICTPNAELIEETYEWILKLFPDSSTLEINPHTLN